MKYALDFNWLMAAIIGGMIAYVFSENFGFGVFIFAIILIPAFVKLYVPYAEDNPQGLWFKRKLYGWGWTPVTWQGWALTFGYIAAILLFAFTVDENSPTREVMFTFVLPTVFLTILFLRIAYKKGEKPKWQWGRDKDEN